MFLHSCPIFYTAKMLKSLRYQFKDCKSQPSVWLEGSVEDEEDFFVVEVHDEDADGRRSENDCAAWDVPRLLGLEGDNSSILCETALPESNRVLNKSHIQKLYEELPASLQLCEWTLVYQTQTHGTSLRSLYRLTHHLDHPMILLIKDTCGQVFGALCSAPIRVSPTYTGTGQSFLFSFSPHLQVYRWTGVNSYFMKASVDSLLFGGGRGHFGLWLHSDLLRGRSQPCETFNNNVLSFEEDFMINELEVWALN